MRNGKLLNTHFLSAKLAVTYQLKFNKIIEVICKCYIDSIREEKNKINSPRQVVNSKQSNRHIINNNFVVLTLVIRVDNYIANFEQLGFAVGKNLINLKNKEGEFSSLF